MLVRAQEVLLDHLEEKEKKNVLVTRVQFYLG